MTTYEVDLHGQRRRCRHSAEFKQIVVGECRGPGVSIAAVALHHRLNTNMLRKWKSTPNLTGPWYRQRRTPVRKITPRRRHLRLFRSH